MSEVLALESAPSAVQTQRSQRQLQATKRRYIRRSVLLILPLLALLVLGFLTPIGALLSKSVENPEVAGTLPKTLVQLKNWDGQALPGESAFSALGEDLRSARSN